MKYEITISLFIAPLMLLLAAMPAHAAYTDAEQDYCHSLAKLGASVMTLRQTGWTRSAALQLGRDNIEDDRTLKLDISLIYAAYMVPDFNQSWREKQAINSFSGELYLECQKKYAENDK